MKSQNTKKEYRVFSRKLHQSWQQVTAMEISLQELRASKKISSDQFKRRAKLLKEQKNKIRSMKHQLDYEEKLLSRSKELGFPKLENLSSLEFLAIEDYFNGRFYATKDMYRNIIKMAPWVEEAASGKASFKSIFRLARIKFYLSKLREETQKVGLDIQLQRKLLKKLSILVLGESFNEKDSIFNQISLAFSGADKLRQKISNLERKISQKKQEIHYMKNWLLETRTNIRKKVPEPPPEFQTLRSLNSGIEIYGIDQVNRSKERLTLASVYVQSYEKRYAPWEYQSEGGRSDGT